MKPQEAISRISQLKVRPKPDNALDLCAVIMAKKALQKQIPKRLTKNSGFGVCPNCNVIVAMREKSHGLRVIPHCKWCGQALDWGG